MKIKVDIHDADIKKRIGRASKEAQRMLKSDVVQGSAKYVPHLTGALRASAAASVNAPGPFIIYKTPYARFLYYGKLMVSPSTGSAWAKPGEVKRPTQKDLKYSQAGTGPEWFEKWKGADGDAAVRRVLEAWAAVFEGRQP